MQTPTSPSIQSITDWMQEHLSDYMDYLHQLVNVDCGTRNINGVNTVGNLFRQMLQTTGCEIIQYPLSEFGDCYRATWHGKGHLRLLIAGHLDTVFPDGTVAERPLRLEGNRMLGPGVTDMKSGLLGGLFAIQALQACGFDDFASIDFFVNSDEEVDSPASRALYRPIAEQVDAALVLEAARANGNIVSARKGCASYTFTVHGRQAHAGVEIEKGINAIIELARCILELSALNNPPAGVTLNVGVINGGTASNVVPDRAWMDIDARFTTIAAGVELDKAVRQVAERITVPGARIEVKGGISKNPMEKTPGTTYLAELAHQAGEEMGIHFQDVLTGGTSDANFISAAGIPTLDGLGPIGGLDHSPYEFLEVDSIVPRVTMLARLITSIAANLDSLIAIKQNTNPR